MKQETVSTFSGGLNYDIHPLVTPNTILTDTLNGTFITFNGNELSLQNDAGNIVLNIENSNDTISTYDPNKLDYIAGDLVSVTDSTNRLRYYQCLLSGTTVEPNDDGINWLEYIVRLSPGFEPIGVKEYGGVLYIISRKQVGNVPDPTVDEIEFGSFPSPERYDQLSGQSNIFDIELVDIDGNLTDDIPNILYNPKIINEIIFRPGEHITFSVESLGLDTSYLSTLTTSKFYKLKLLQQLTSGYLDLTEDIKTKYIQYGGLEDHWILDSTFIYPCPFLYKGKLALSLEIEPINFYITSTPEVNYNIGDVNTYSVDLSLRSEFGTDPKAISVSGANILFYTDDGYTLNNDSINVSIGTITSSGLCDIVIEVIDIPNEHTNKTLYYTIEPAYDWDTYLVGDEEYIPSNYKDLYKIQGMLLLSNLYSNILFSLDNSLVFTTNNTCGVGSDYGYRTYNELLLTNGSDLYINNELEISETPYVVVSSGTAPTVGNTSLGTYIINSSGIISSFSPNVSLLSLSNQIILTNALVGKLVKVEDSSCLTVQLTINAVMPYIPLAKIRVTQEGITREADNYGVFDIKPNIEATIEISPNSDISNMFESIYDSIVISSNTEYNYMMIAKLAFYHITNIDPSINNNYIVLWDGPVNIGQPNLTINFRDFIYQSNISVAGQLQVTDEYLGFYRNVFITNGVSIIDDRMEGKFNWYEFTDVGMDFNSPTTFRNIANQSDYISLDTSDVIFKKRDIFKYQLSNLIIP